MHFLSLSNYYDEQGDMVVLLESIESMIQRPDHTMIKNTAGRNFYVKQTIPQIKVQIKGLLGGE